MVVGALGRLDVLLVAAPGLQRCRLEGATVRKGELPRMRAHRIHRVQSSRCLFLGLPARKEDDSRYRRGNVPAEATDGLVGDLLVGYLLRAFVTREHHVWLQQDSFGVDALVAQLG